MSELTAEEEERREVAMQRMLDNPMPRELEQAVADEIEPHTLNASLKHREVMIAIAIAYPLIRDWSRDNDTPAVDLSRSEAR
jgi:hypothetical protein